MNVTVPAVGETSCVVVRPSLFDSVMYEMCANDGDTHVLVDRPR
jgi:hypothetical protein